jgi:ribosome-associated protein
MPTLDLSPEFQFQTSRSSGAGGQNVNKVETKVELRFDILASQILSDEQKQRLLEKLANQLVQESILLVSSQEKRSQLQNKEITIKKFFKILEKAFYEPKKRKPSKPSAQAKENRLKTKKEAGEKKVLRKKVDLDE